MNILKEVIKHEVYPSLGCTEPIAVAYAASQAAKALGQEFDEIRIVLDPGVYKSGFAVMVPNTDGERGNLIAGALGALIARPELKMEILKEVPPEVLASAKNLVGSGQAHMTYDRSRGDLYIEIVLKRGNDFSRAVISGSHTNLVVLEKNGRFIVDRKVPAGAAQTLDFKAVQKEMTLLDFVALAEQIDRDDYEYLESGVKMNLAVSQEGKKLKKIGHYVYELKEKGYIPDDVFTSSKILTASAVDARMAGLSLPVMTSGGSGNQGVSAILVPYNVGCHLGIEQSRIIKSIALSHMINSYIKCFTGELSPLCGCAIASGVGAAIAIVFQQYPTDTRKMTLAANNLISDLGGMLCDGAKGGCALKIASSTDSAIRAAFMALEDYGINPGEGFVGKTTEETIRHLSQISKAGMGKVDETMLEIMMNKAGDRPFC